MKTFSSCDHPIFAADWLQTSYTPPPKTCRNRFKHKASSAQHESTMTLFQIGRLNPHRESGVHHFHELLREAYRARA
jgi:hypothetical protein